MPNKVCQSCGHSCGPRNFFCPCCEKPFTKTLKKAKHSYIPQMALSTPPPAIAVSRMATPSSIPAVAFKCEAPGILNLDPGNEFDDLYGKTDALNVVMSALAVYNQTNSRNRYHSLLIGSPAAGKSEIATRLMNVVGRENVLEVNAYDATKAGMEETILTYPGDLPPVLIYQELDKVKNEEAISWMLGALDTNQEIIRINKTDGLMRRKVPFISIATCNSLDKVKKFHGGAIADRFTNKLHVPDMTDDMRYAILTNKIKTLPNFNEKWVDKAIEYCHYVGDLSMRKLESVLMCGQDRLLTGEYQASLDATRSS